MQPSRFATTLSILCLSLFSASAFATAPTPTCPAGSSGVHVLAGWMVTSIPQMTPITYHHAGTRHDSCNECEIARARLIDSHLEVHSAASVIDNLPNGGQGVTSANIMALREANVAGGNKLWTELPGGAKIVNAVRINALTCLPATLL